MKILYSFVSPPDPCGYLKDREWTLHYDVVGELSHHEYYMRMVAGWRRFGFAMFRPVCEGCTECKSVRVDVAKFTPNRSQRRAWNANCNRIRRVVDKPSVNQEKLDLYDRFHVFQAENIGWPHRGRESLVSYVESFIENPFDNEEWCYYEGDKLIGVGYVDRLHAGLSGIYFFYDPDQKEHSLGTFNVLSLIQDARDHHLPHVYLGYYVAGCRSLEYKAKFRPNEYFDQSTGLWKPVQLEAD